MKNDHIQATKMRTFLRGVVFGTKPRIPTTSMVTVHTAAEITTTFRRPNRSVTVIKVMEVPKAITAKSKPSQPTTAVH